ncbi:hypothetical protein DFJ43DRAFT_632682 [Lentinula guzmanii]|uniref:Uncharacterized protein n=2 Tax=Lentinula TaxID=5352 RepID=A0AA38JUS1_9AGAR|nr:hypothetical protein DFJ43DRAFT_632682 [Lentinula guzmanii]KAJ3788729.1 hypothetical protein GGU10DRAFT_95541 [Lentinula aff. detonsa]
MSLATNYSSSDIQSHPYALPSGNLVSEKHNSPGHICDHYDWHYLVRCGCPNDRPPSHPMYFLDDAFHREWCAKCLMYCYQPPHCKHTSHEKRRFIQPLLLATLFKLIARIFKPFRGCI